MNYRDRYYQSFVGTHWIFTHTLSGKDFNHLRKIYRKKFNSFLPPDKNSLILTERAFSHYLMGVRDGWAPQSFEEALEREAWECNGEQSEPLTLNHFYKRAGLYAEQIRHYRKLFSKEQLKIYLYEDLRNEPVKTVQDIYKYLDVDADFVPDTQLQYNVYGVPKLRRLHQWLSLLPYQQPIRPTAGTLLPSPIRARFHNYAHRVSPAPKSQIAERTRQALIAYFRPQVEELEAMLQRDLSHWLV